MAAAQPLVSPLGGPYSSKGAEGPFIWQDSHGTFKMIFHGYGGDGRITDGQIAWSTDPHLLEWHWQPEPLYSSTIVYTNVRGTQLPFPPAFSEAHDKQAAAQGSSEDFTRRERPALLFDADMNPTHLYK